MSVPDHINIIPSFSPAAQLLHCVDSWAALNFYFYLRNQTGSTGNASNSGLYANISRRQPWCPLVLSSFRRNVFHFDSQNPFDDIIQVSCLEKERMVTVWREWQNGKWALIWWSLNAWNRLLPLWENFDLFSADRKGPCSVPVYTQIIALSPGLLQLMALVCFELLFFLSKNCKADAHSRLLVMLTCIKLGGSATLIHN